MDTGMGIVEPGVKRGRWIHSWGLFAFTISVKPESGAERSEIAGGCPQGAPVGASKPKTGKVGAGIAFPFSIACAFIPP